MGKNGLTIVTGGAGFIGKNLVQELVDRGVVPYLIDNFTNSEPHDLHPSCVYYGGDVRDIGKLYPSKVDVIYHLAGQSRVQPSFEDPVGSVESNVNGTLAVLEYARKHKCKVVYAGSSSKHQNIYDSPYSTSKALGEDLCFMYRECYDVDVSVCRFYNIYGPGESLDPVNGNVIGIWRHLINTNQTIKIVGDGEQRRDFTHVGDLVDALITIGESKLTHTDAWELGTGVNHSINDLYSMFKERYPSIQKEHIPNQPGNYKETMRVNDDALEILNWEPKDRLKEYITKLR